MNMSVIKTLRVRIFFVLAFVFSAVIPGQAADYEIYTLSDLQAITPDHLADRCLLMNDIDASETADWNEGRGFEPIGRLAGVQVGLFTGRFLGNNHRITGLTIHSPVDNVGLFASVGPGAEPVIIQDLILEDVNVSGFALVGALAGSVNVTDAAAGVSVMITDCTVLSGRVDSTDITADTSMAMGGLIGAVGAFGPSGEQMVLPDGVQVTIQDCVTACDVSGGQVVGGLLGFGQEHNAATSTVALIRNTTQGTVTSLGTFAGGMVGALSDGLINDCTHTGSVEGTAQVGGLSGLLSGVSLATRNSSSGTVTATGLGAGGLFGGIEATSVVSDSFSTAAVIGTDFVGGFAGISKGTIETCYSTGAVTGTGTSVSGFLGSLADAGVLTNNFWDGNRSGIMSGNLPGQMEVLSSVEMTQPDKFITWNFDTVWTMETTAGYATCPFFLFRGGEGLETDPYRVSDVYGLQGVGNSPDAFFVMISDVDASMAALWNDGAGFQPMTFSGHLDGQAHVIRNLFINRSLLVDNVGLFATLNETAQVRSLTIENARVVGGSSVGTGILAGLSRGLIQHCIVSGQVSGMHHIGGLVGSQNGGTISTCVSLTEVRGEQSVGGLVGATSDGLIEGSQSRGNVHGSEDVGGLAGTVTNTRILGCASRGEITGYQKVGGLIGNGVDEGSEITQCLFQGEVTGYIRTGGLMGSSMGTTTLSSCSGSIQGDLESGGLVGHLSGSVRDSMSTVDVQGRSRVGGFAASLTNTGRITRCYSKGAVNGDTLTGGFVGLNLAGPEGVLASYWDRGTSGLEMSDGGQGLDTDAMMQETSYETWAFETIWGIHESVTRPVLLWDTQAADLSIAVARDEDPWDADLTLTNLGPNPATQVAVEVIRSSLAQPLCSTDNGDTWLPVDGRVQVAALEAGESLRILFRADETDTEEPATDTEIRVVCDSHDPDLANNTLTLTARDTSRVYAGDGSGCFISTLND